MPLFDRTDFRVTRGVLLAAAVVAPLALVAVPAAIWIAGGDLGWNGFVGPDGASLAGLVTPEHAARLRWDGQAQMRLPDAPAGLWLATLVPRGIEAAAVVVVALLVRRVLGQIQVGRPFTAVSLRALRVIGLTIVGAAVVLPFADGLVSTAVAAHATDGEFALKVSFNPLWLLGGVLVLALAEAFRAGARLADDVEGLV